MQWSPVPATAVSSASDYPDFIPLQVIDAFSSSASDWGATSRQAAGGQHGFACSSGPREARVLLNRPEADRSVRRLSEKLVAAEVIERVPGTIKKGSRYRLKEAPAEAPDGD